MLRDKQLQSQSFASDSRPLVFHKENNAQERAQQFIDRMAPMLYSYRIVMDMADGQVVRGRRF